MPDRPTIDLAVDSAHKIVLDADFADLKQAIAALGTWTSQAAETVDFFYVDRAIRLLRSRAAARRDLDEMIEHLGWAAHDRARQDLNTLGRAYFERWRTVRDLMVARRDALTHDRKKEVEARKHVTEAMAALRGAKGKMMQGELGEKLNLRKVNLTRVLNLMEAHGLVERRRAGAENCVHISPPRVAMHERWGGLLTRQAVPSTA
jgi:DNA-binding PadR family transcriptional regulator